ncbi:MAG: ABC transporter permease [Actinobacteria bacterium]|nr:ABC transporter permease [Actinomycetota bacterium]
MAAVAEQWRENRPTAGARVLRLGELWSYRELVYFLALRDVKSRYKQAFFGIGWTVFQPIVGVAIFTVVFRRLAEVPSEGVPYSVFALLGFVIWSYFAGSFGNASGSLVANASLVTKIYFPRLAAPIASLLPGLVHLTIGLALLSGLMALVGFVPSLAAPLLAVCVLWTMAVALGPGLLFATMNVKYRDVGAVAGFLTQLWFLASPVAYPSSLVPDAWRWAYAANPMVGVLDTARWAVLGTPRPGPEILVSLGVTLALLGLGLLYFQRTEREFADVI